MESQNLISNERQPDRMSLADGEVVVIHQREEATMAMNRIQ